MFRILFLSYLLLLSCGPDPKPDDMPEPDDRMGELRALDAAVKAEAVSLRDPTNGWLTPSDCDGMLWTGKYASVSGVSGVDISAAEYADEPGRFGRRPMTDPCTSTNTQWSSFSGDMGKGLVSYALHTGDLATLERHAAYGHANKWVMGKPFGDGRALYKPGMIGLVMAAVHKLGGADSVERHYINSYPSGAVDFAAHLIVFDIYLRWRAGATVSQSDLDMLIGHTLREPRNPFYAAVLALYTGDFSVAIGLLLDPAMPVGEYVRCDNFRSCQIAEWLYATNIVLNHGPQ